MICWFSFLKKSKVHSATGKVEPGLETHRMSQSAQAFQGVEENNALALKTERNDRT